MERITTYSAGKKITQRAVTGLSLSLLTLALQSAWAQQNNPTLTVTAQSQESHGSKLSAKESSSATKTDTPLVETPQSVSVITRQQMDDQNARSLNEALRYTPGVAAEQWGGVTAFDQFTIRGFNYSDTGYSDVFQDGLRNTNGLLFGVQQVDPFLLEQVDVMRGPASVIYGLSNPGGVIALTSKLPTRETIRHVEVEGGTDNYGRVGLDFGGALNDSGSVLYRLVATGHLADGMQQGTKLKGYAVAPSITFNPDDNNSLTLYSRFQYDPNLGAITSLPAYGTVFSNPNGKLPLDAYPGEPNHNTFSRKQSTVGYSYTHSFSEDWSTVLKGRYFGETSNYDAVVMSGLNDDMHTISRNTAVSDEHYNTLNFDNQIHGFFDTGSVSHELLTGVSVDHMRGHANYGSGSVSSLDIYHPTYGVAEYGPTAWWQDSRVSSTQTGVYLQDQISWQQWRTTLGIRHDWSKIINKDFLYGQNYEQHDQATTGRIGLNYLFNNGISPYFTWSQSFQPVAGLSRDQQPFKPSRGELYEFGVKYQPPGTSTLLSAAIYNLTQDKSLSSDPVDTAFQTQGGKIRARGLELEARGALTDQFSLIGSYTLQQVKYTQDTQGREGKTPLRVPRTFGALWLDWQAPAGTPVEGLGMAVGGRFSGGTKGGTMDNQFNTGGYGLMDASVRYELGKLDPSLRGGKVQLTAQNLLDRKVVAGCYSTDTGCFWGAGRQVIAKFSWDF
ncbi:MULTISPECIES: TonB-dependent siderophore receptor [unclassified Pantoea]|uniref:TonB-dependent siderophore receptor n=1 Tax=unclassified Pantoea TaxID=2630326 RepID=UPI00301D7E15